MKVMRPSTISVLLAALCACLPSTSAAGGRHLSQYGRGNPDGYSRNENYKGFCVYKGKSYKPDEWAECSGSDCEYKWCQCKDGKWGNCNDKYEDDKGFCVYKGKSYKPDEWAECSGSDYEYKWCQCKDGKWGSCKDGDNKDDCKKDLKEELQVKCHCQCGGKGDDDYSYFPSNDDYSFCKEDLFRNKDDYSFGKEDLFRDKDDKKDKDFGKKDDKEDKDDKQCPVSKRIIKVDCDCKCPKVMKDFGKKDDNKKDFDDKKDFVFGKKDDDKKDGKGVKDFGKKDDDKRDDKKDFGKKDDKKDDKKDLKDVLDKGGKIVKGEFPGIPDDIIGDVIDEVLDVVEARDDVTIRTVDEAVKIMEGIVSSINA